MPPLVAARFQMQHDPQDEAEREFIMNTQELYETWKQQVEADARGQTLLTLYEARFGAPSAEIRAAIKATHDAATLDRWTVLLGTRAEVEVRAALLGRSG